MKLHRLLPIALLGMSLPAQAIENIEMNSFLTIGASAMSEDGRYLDMITEHLSFENDSVYGINIRTDVSDRVSGAAQLLATSTSSNFNVEAEWAYVSYKFTDASSIRAGKLNLTTFLLSDYANVGYLFPWIRPPVEVYENNPLKNFLGVEWLHLTRFGKTAKLTTQVFVGSAQVEDNGLTFRATDGIGINFQLDTAHYSLRLGGISPNIQLEQQDATTGVVGDVVDLDDRGFMYTVGASVDWNNFVLYSEAMTTDTEGATQAIFPNQNGAYLTLGYQMGKYLPHVTFGTSDGDNYTGALPANIPGARLPVTQDTTTLGLRYDVNESVALKFEYQIVNLEENKGDGFGSIDDNVIPNTVDSFDVISVAMDVIF
ncbi:MAG: hypothetical protein OQK98_03220 [Gammaproteobacteria bacterium]|nr:hypothetical protein [Gammaproteobacteria bacterium]